MEIGFIGLGKLGGPCAEVMSEKHNVCGYDITKVELNGVKITSNIEDTVKEKDFTFIAVPTPHHVDYDGRYPTSHLPPKDFNYESVLEVLKQIKDVKSDSVICLISTVLPGTIRREFLKHCFPDRFLYNPYLIAMGSVKDDMRRPEMVIVGNMSGNYDHNVAKLQEFYKTISENSRFVHGTWEEAESIKIFYNTFISMKLSFANMVMDVSQAIGNMNCHLVMDALQKSTKRIISKEYLNPGMGDGGPCHPRDNIALRFLSKEIELGYDLFGDIMRIREQQALNLAKELVSFNRPVVILGKSFKPGVSLTDGSYSILVGHFVKELGFDCYFEDDKKSGGNYTYLIGHSKGFENYSFEIGSIIVDPWGTFQNIPSCHIVRYGKN